ncbi:DUF2244 domain-containing protein [Pseudodonghicola flavimaris]|uniref:DUF2244 domain-containing protein n=1 Tax=Pseudodonghicola flavimaris TaxID=3050036 RepID=A0ABT7F003_9RHOB|nr:DUF2244 domain-containing protein [Pseudodonghicola flavimaris]MDK3017932.1 DUF2244 domain-containing protein [Pseudodonghicola flavimaris]
MPYHWTDPDPDRRQLQLWPHNSLPPRGLAIFVLATFALLMVPLLSVLGSVLLWGLLPFILLAVGGVWYALGRSYRDRRILETLTLDETMARLTRRNPDGQELAWECNRYWATVEMHPHGGPVEHYVTLKGAGREVEIGAFLSEEEREALYLELLAAFRR